MCLSFCYFTPPFTGTWAFPAWVAKYWNNCSNRHLSNGAHLLGTLSLICRILGNTFVFSLLPFRCLLRSLKYNCHLLLCLTADFTVILYIWGQVQL